MSVTIKTWSLPWKKSDSLHADTCNWLKSVLLLHSQLFSNQMWIRRHCIKNNNKNICSSWFYHHHSLEAALLRIFNEILTRKDEHFWFNSIIQILTLIIAENFGFSSVILSCRVSQGFVLGIFKGVTYLTYDMISSYTFYFFTECCKNNYQLSLSL